MTDLLSFDADRHWFERLEAVGRCTGCGGEPHCKHHNLAGLGFAALDTVANSAIVDHIDGVDFVEAAVRIMAVTSAATTITPYPSFSTTTQKHS